MSPDISANGSTAGSTNDSARSTWHERRGRGMCQSKGKWSPFNIVAMVLGFVVFWPIGLVLLFWILSGRDVRDLPAAIQRKWQAFSQQSRVGLHRRGGSDNAMDNTVFNAYQQTQWDRVREIEGEIRDRAKRFMDFRADAKRRADEKEFSEFREFMNSQPTADASAPNAREADKK